MKTRVFLTFLAVVGLAQSTMLSAPVRAVEGAVRPGEQRKGWNFRDAALIPVQSGGRLKPLDTWARELMLFLTGSRYYQGWDPVDLAFSLMTASDTWEGREFIQVGRGDVKRQIGLPEERTRFSPKELFADSYLVQYARETNTSKAPAKDVVGSAPKKDPRDEELRRTVERLVAFRRVGSGEAWPVIPMPGTAPWATLAGSEPEGGAIRAAFARMAVSHHRDDREGFEKAAAEVRSLVEGAVQAKPPHFETGLKVELLYNRLHPFLWAWILYLASAIFWIPAILLRGSKPESPAAKRLFWTAMVGTLAALGFHVFGFLLRCYVAGRPPVTNMYESIIWVGFGIVVFAFILYRSQRQPVLLATACGLAALAMVAADSAPAMMDPGIHPLVPVLRSNYWLTIHVLTITISYAAFALALGLGNISLWHFMRAKKGYMAKIEGLNQLTYRSQQFGVVLLAAGTILGGVWADYSWGRFWGWDPKEVWALIALLNYLVILHARYTSWVGQFGFALWSVLAFLGVVMAWYGVNFVLGVGLHSYGFSTGGRGTVFTAVLLQSAYCAAAAVAWKRHRMRQHSGNPTGARPAEA